jgi:hypothetical protein
MIRQRVKALALEPRGRLLHALTRQAINDAEFAAMTFEELE